MRHLGEFLIKYQSLGVGERLTKELFVETVNNLLGKAVLRMENVSVNGSTVKIKAEGAVRSEIFLQKNKILKTIQEKAGRVSSPAVKHIR